ncbi:ComEA family DNA-binding protein [Lewinella sp. IMCC34191]|uniref:ComEA family DNA-binding protein n=1 Tax=Lewinella sp. IMCC34191 TaxID=2259172 RepID=UPI000E274CF7|nr:helix-hairpin-helix domain-containing protein [Lewinella sp. IMCC34191]
MGLLTLLLFIAGAYGLSKWLSRPPRPAYLSDDSELFAAADKMRSAMATDEVSDISKEEAFPFDPNTVTEADLQRLGLSAKQATAFVRYREKVKFRQPRDLNRLRVLRPEQARKLISWARIAPQPRAVPETYAKAPEVTSQRFSFDPNTLPYDSLLLLGLTEREARALVKYRSYRPVTFRKPEDLRRVSALDSSKVQGLMDLINLPVPEESALPAPRRPESAESPSRVDINRASATDWQQLPGIGAYRAKSIVAYRERLGGFAATEQVGETYGLPDSTFRAMLPYLEVSPVTRPLFINQADASTLAAHPYLPRRTATIIVRYRENHGPYRSAEDLKKVRAVSTETLDKLLPYLNFAL